MAKEEEQAAKEGKKKALEAALAKIEKDFGKGSIMRMGDNKVENVDVIPTGSIALNLALGVGGFPKGRIIEIYGPESSKSRRYCSIHRCRACFRPFLCRKIRRRYRQPVHITARQW